MLDDLEALASYICEDAASAFALLSQFHGNSGSFSGIAPAFLPKAQRRAVIRIAISIYRDEINALLRPYEAGVSHSDTDVQSSTRIPATVLTRLVQLMIFHDRYAVRDCSLLLKTHDDVVKSITLQILEYGCIEYQAPSSVVPELRGRMLLPMAHLS
jgi:hypothetical protein